MALPEGLTAQLWVAACTIAAPTMLGLGILRALGLRRTHGLRTAVALAYLIGHYALAHVTTAWLAVGQPFPGFVLPLLAALLGLALTRLARDPLGPRGVPERASRWTLLPLLTLSLLFVHDVTVANVEPIRFSDEAQIWAAKAKALYCAPVVDLQMGMGALVHHADYPALNPLVQVLCFASAGHVTHFENRLPIQFFGLALLALLSAATSRRAHPVFAVLVLLAFAGTVFWNNALTVYADVLLALATLATVECLLRLRETGERVWWRLACLSTGAMLATKNEGALLALAVIGPFAVAHLASRGESPVVPRRALRELGWLLVPITTLALHRAFNAHFDLTNDLAAGDGLLVRTLHQAPAYAPRVAAFYGRMFVDPAQHALLPLLFAAAASVALLAGRRGRIGSPAATLLATTVCAILGYMLVFVGTPADLTWHMDTAAARTMQQIVPVAALGLCMVAWPRARPGTDRDLVS